MLTKLISLWAFCVFAVASQKISINGTGTVLTKYLINRWIFDYSFAQPDVAITYQTFDDEIYDEDEFTEDPYVQFYVSESQEVEAFEFPFVSLAIVPVYNLPELDNEKLILSRDTLALIFMGNVSYWNDARILQDNANNGDVVSKLPNAPIQLVLCNKDNEATELFTTSLESWSSEWENSFGEFSAWNSTLTANLPNVTTWPTAYQTAAAVSRTPYTMTYTSVDISQCYKLQDAAMINKAGNVVSATVDSLIAAQQTLTTDNFWKASLIDTDGNNSWPMTTFSFVYTDPEHKDCTLGRDVLKFWVWALKSNKRRSEQQNAGYAPLEWNFVQEVVKQFEKLQCDGKTLLEFEMEDQHNGSKYDAVLGLAMALMVLWWAISAGSYYYNTQKTLIPTVYSFLVIIGSTLGFLSIIFWYLVPSEDWICQSRVWLSALGLTITCAAMFSRMLQVLVIYSVVIERNYMKNNVFNWFHSYGAASTIILIQFILLIAFQIADPWKHELVVNDALNYEGEWKCSYPIAWIAVEAAFFGMLFLFGLYVVYRTWEWEGVGSESKLLLVALYTIILISTSFGIISNKLEDDDQIFYFIAFGILLIVVSITSVVSIPFSVKMFVAWFKEYSSSLKSKTSELVKSGQGTVSLPSSETPEVA